MREIKVRVTWETDHTVEVPNSTPEFTNSWDDLKRLMEVSGDPLDPAGYTSMVDWNIQDDDG